MNLFHAQTRRNCASRRTDAIRVLYFLSLQPLRLCDSAGKIYKFLFILIILCFISCNRGVIENNKIILSEVNEARPMAVLQTGENPLWFQLTENGPIHIGSIEDAINSTAIVPWTHAYNICFLQERRGDLIMIANRDGFLKIAPNAPNEPNASNAPNTDSEQNTDELNLALYRFSGGELWRNYTTGGLIFYDDKPAALIYLDNRFLDSDLPMPRDRTWSFSMDSNDLFSLRIPAFQNFYEEEGWEIDVLRLGEDGLYYYRAARRSGDSPQVRMFRTDDLARQGNEITIDVFYHSFPKKVEISAPNLPVLPEGFFYTGMEQVGDSIFASWEEQHDYSVGAAGFMLIKK